MKLRAGVQRIEGNCEVPIGAKEFLSKTGRKCYLSGVDQTGMASVRFIDTGEFMEVELKKIEKLWDTNILTIGR